MSYHITIKDNETGKIVIDNESDCIMGAFTNTETNALHEIEYADTDIVVAKAVARRVIERGRLVIRKCEERLAE